MKLLEYKAQELFAQYDILTMNGVVINDTKDVGNKINSAGLSYPVVIKAQVQTGGRAKAGGIQFADNAEQAQSIAQKLLFSELKGFLVNNLFFVEKASPQKEWYLSIMLDRISKCPLIIFSTKGGIDIEETAKFEPDMILRVPVNPALGITDYNIRYILTRGGIGTEWTTQMKSLLEKLYALFMEYSCMLVEINPLAVNESGLLIALDGKVDIDDSALYRLPDIQEFAKTLPVEPFVQEAADYNFLLIPIEEDGDIAVMSNGSGMLMSCIDLISKRGMKVGTALDLGGGATAERIEKVVQIVLSNPKTDVMFISIFGGITRCDEVAKGIKSALEAIEKPKTVIVRIEGTNKHEGLNIISSIECGKVISTNSIPEGVQALAEWRGLA